MVKLCGGCKSVRMYFFENAYLLRPASLPLRVTPIFARHSLFFPPPPLLIVPCPSLISISPSPAFPLSSLKTLFRVQKIWLKILWFPSSSFACFYSFKVEFFKELENPWGVSYFGSIDPPPPSFLISNAPLVLIFYIFSRFCKVRPRKTALIHKKTLLKTSTLQDT